MADIDEIIGNFSVLDDWDDRYRYLIELGRELAALPEAARTDANKVQGCASQVWLDTAVRPDGSDGPVLSFEGDSDAHIVRGLIAILFALYSGKIGKAHPVDRRGRAVRDPRLAGTSYPATLERVPLDGGSHPLRCPRIARKNRLRPALNFAVGGRRSCGSRHRDPVVSLLQDVSGHSIEQPKSPPQTDGRIRGLNLQRPVDRLLSVLRGADFLRPDRSSIVLRHRGDIFVRCYRRRDRGATQFAVLRGCRARQFDLGRARRAGRKRDPAGHCLRRHRSARTDADRSIADHGAHGIAALCARFHACGPGNPLRALSGDRRLPRRHRLADDHRRDAGDDQSASDARHDPEFPRCRDRGEARTGRPGRNHALRAATPAQKPLHLAHGADGRVRGDPSRAAGVSHHARRRPSRRLDVPIATGGRIDAALEMGRVAQLSLVGSAGDVRRPARRHVRHDYDIPVEHDGYRDRDPKRGRCRARPESARACQYRQRRVRRLCELHFVEPLDSRPQRRRNKPLWPVSPWRRFPWSC